MGEIGDLTLHPQVLEIVIAFKQVTQVVVDLTDSPRSRDISLE
jgi:hypothetical protein